MSLRSTRLILMASAFVAGLVACLGLILLFIGPRGPVAQSVAAIGGPFALVDQNGRTITDQDLKGRPTLMFFGFTHCPDVCPTALFEISQVMDRLGPLAEKVNAVFVTVDPERDTPAVLKDYLSSFHPRMMGLTGEPSAIAAMLKAYRVYARKVPQEGGHYTMDHSALVYLLDKEGRFVAPFNLKRSPEDAAADLKRHV
jgi:protein SCO1/2